MQVIIGLGNPGSQYAATRHNMGFMALERVSRRLGIPVEKKGFAGLYGKGVAAGKPVLLAQPMTYMNESGQCVGQIVRYFHVDLRDVLVVYDDIDLPCGKLRMRLSGSAGTHNGMRSIVAHLGDTGFPRLRVGVGRPRPGGDLIQFVLGTPGAEERALLAPALDRAAETAEAWVCQGAEAAMQLANQTMQPEGGGEA